MPKKHILLVSMLFIALFLCGCASNNSNSSAEDIPIDENAKIIFFYGRECSHCKNVEEFFAKENVAEKIDFAQAEVYHNQENAEIMKKKAEICNLDLNNLGVPMLWNDGKCLLGDEPIIEFFKEKLKSGN